MTAEKKRAGSIDDFAVIPETERVWRNLSAGIEMAYLLKDSARDFMTVLLRFEPGATAARHQHPLGEQFFVVEGSLVDACGTYDAGTFVNYPPGSIHQPTSPDGALVLVQWWGKPGAY